MLAGNDGGKRMTCPKCSEEMLSGEIAYLYGKGGLIWAPKGFFESKVCNMYTKNGAIAAGGMEIPLGDGYFRDRTMSYACRKCNFVLIDCNKCK